MTRTNASTSGRALAATSPRTRLLLLSFLMLFVELMLIRWTAAFVIYISYFTNFVLLASFLGIGIGFLRRSSGGDGVGRAPLWVFVLVAFVLVFPVQVSRAGERELVGLAGLPALPIWVMLPVIFALTVLAMASIAASVADAFETFEPLSAYRYDILGSIAGTVTFSALAFLRAPPLVWGVVVAVLLLALVPRRRSFTTVVAPLAALLVVVGVATFQPLDSWSPYYRVTRSETSAEGVTGIRVNGLPHQAMLPVDLLATRQPFYLFPYRYVDEAALEDVLVVGAGSGNDVAVALSMGARHVDAVEIDPEIMALGEELHPDAPYADPRVSPHIDDGRAFLERTDDRYDLIVFALPDSLTLVSGQGSLRLESYLFTEEAMTTVRDHLSPDGVFAMYNYYRPDVFERFYATMTTAFGHAPCVDRVARDLGPRDQAVLTISRDPGRIACASSVPFDAATSTIATDDRPFPYLSSRSVPRFYAITLALILLASLLAVRTSTGPLRDLRPYVDLFLMGVAFLLLETKNVVQFALLFGTTWFVNALVFTGILLAVLGAIEIARRRRLPSRRVLYAALLVSIAVAWSVPPTSLLGLSVLPRFIAAATLAFAPVLLANVIFAQRFRDVASSTTAFGANLLGAMVGGVLEYAALVTGYRNLLIVVAVVYAGALATSPRAAKAT